MAQVETSAPAGAPMRPVEFYVLLALAGGERHGYAILQATAQQAGSGAALDPGTLYRAIARLQRDGLIRESGKRPAEDLEGRRRRYYALTENGREAASAESRRLAGLVKLAGEHHLLDDPRTA